MKEYLDFVTAVMLTALAIGIVGGIAVGGVILYKIIKDKY